MTRIERHEAVHGVATLGCAEVRGVVPAPAALDEELARTTGELSARLAGLSAGQIPHLQPARELYRSIGLDPTKRRPSPEALLRRILRGDPFPRVHAAVDLGNLWAIVHGLPVGLYDLAAVEGGITLRIGRPGESYPGIRKDEVHLDGRLLLADGRGPFGNPSADSLRTCVTAGTRDLLYVVFAPAGYDVRALRGWLAWLAERTPRCLGAPAETAISN